MTLSGNESSPIPRLERWWLKAEWFIRRIFGWYGQ